MTDRACLIVEGHGDQKAVPELIRRVLYEVCGEFGFTLDSSPIRCKDIPYIRRPGILEKFLRYACMRGNCDSVILLLDCDDDCPVDVAGDFVARAHPIAIEFEKPIAIGFIKCEFESLFLHSIDSIMAANPPPSAYDLHEIENAVDLESVRGAKGMFQRAIPTKSYKETRDQSRYVHCLDFQQLRASSRSYRHLESMIQWVIGFRPGAGLVYPAV